MNIVLLIPIFKNTTWLQRRCDPVNDIFDNCLEFVGGKINVNEDIDIAGIREFYEEVKIKLSKNDIVEWMSFDFKYPSFAKKHIFKTYKINIEHNTNLYKQLSENKKGQWYDIVTLDKLNIPKANIQIAKELQKEIR